MKITTALLVPAALFCLLGCTNSSDSTTTAETGTTEAAAPADQPEAGTEPAATDAPFSTDATGTEATAATPAPVAGPATVTGITDKPMAGSGLNPAHGEPGHDCAIPVGAPLASAKGKQGGSAPAAPSAPALSLPQPQNSPVQVQQQPAPVPASGSLAAGTNPAHGEPGHDCAIPVGAPLTKK